MSGLAAASIVPALSFPMALLAQLCALGFVALAALALARPVPFPRGAYVIGLGSTAAWSLLCSLHGWAMLPALVLTAEGVRNLAWLWFMGAIAGRREVGWRITPIGTIYVGLCAIQGILVALMIFSIAAHVPIVLLGRRIDLLQMLFATGALVLLHNILDAGRPEERRVLTLPLGAMAGVWAYELNLYAISYLSDAPARLLMEWRPMASAAALVVFALVAFRAPGKAVQLSRPVAFRSLGIAAVGGWLLLLALFIGVTDKGSSNFAAQAQIGIIVVAMASMTLLMLSPRLRGMLRVLIVKHFFEHRYDYRSEWQRFTATLHRPESGGHSLRTRVVKAIADIVESEGGVLIAPAGDGPTLAAQWSRHAMRPAPDVDWAPIVNWLRHHERIVQLDEVRRAHAPEGEALAVDPALLDGHWWIIVPLIHLDEVEGLILLSPPPVNRPLDWEDFDLLRVAGRQAASLLAEARGTEALAERDRFEEFHRRFAFIMHDVKNLASQMGVLARNAERHGDNPAFRDDMIATLRVSAERLTQLMQRLQQQDQVGSAALGAVDVGAVALRVAVQKRAHHAVDVSGGDGLHAQADRDMLETLLGHLVQNAIDATADDTPVQIAIAREGDGVAIRVIDHGAGMTPEFVRTNLFRPFASTKDGGFGIGAYQTRQLAEAMRGTLRVDSRPGEGTTFTLDLPAAEDVSAAAPSGITPPPPNESRAA